MLSQLMIVLGSIVAALLLFWVAQFAYKYDISRKLVRDARPFEKLHSEESKALLVIGDSTGVGVGAKKPDDSVAGRLAREKGFAYVENRARSGARIRDLVGQVSEVDLNEYDTILIQIGGNDIIRGLSPKKAKNQLENILNDLPRSQQVVLMSAGNVGAATFFPWIVRPYYHWLNRQYHQEFSRFADSRDDAVYVNLYEDPENDPFVRHPKKYLAADGLHPSSYGYELWYARLVETLNEK